MKILPIGSGKGGVGKSLIAANLSIALAQAGKSVVLADLDLGASNLHTFLGYRSVQKGIGTYINDSRMKIEEVIIETDYDGMLFIPGDTEIPGTANLQYYQKKKILRNLLSLKTDFLVLDLGAGTNNNIVDFFLCSRFGILITTPQLTAILNAYLFLKNSFFRLIHSSYPKNSRALQYIDQLRKQGSRLQKIHIPQLIRKLREEDPENYDCFLKHSTQFTPYLILNWLTDPKEAERAVKLKNSVKEFLGVELNHLGVIYRDEYQNVALSSRLPVIRYKPNSVLSQAVYRIADKLIEMEEGDSTLLGPESSNLSYQTAELEAESDFCQGGFDRVSLELPVRIVCHLCGNVMVSIWMYPARLGLHV